MHFSVLGGYRVGEFPHRRRLAAAAVKRPARHQLFSLHTRVQQIRLQALLRIDWREGHPRIWASVWRKLQLGLLKSRIEISKACRRRPVLLFWKFTRFALLGKWFLVDIISGYGLWVVVRWDFQSGMILFLGKGIVSDLREVWVRLLLLLIVFAWEFRLVQASQMKIVQFLRWKNTARPT